MNKEKNFTSTSNKLLNHMDRLKIIKYQNDWYPINLQISPTDKCNLNCEFCSVKNRNNDQLALIEILKAVKDFNDIGLKSVEITGGGDPTMYPSINELIEYCYGLGLKIGLITNGIKLDAIKQENLDKLTWLRISLSGLDFGLMPQIPKIKGTLGFSYVWFEKSNLKILKQINNIADKKGTYVRIVPDCLNIETQTRMKNQVLKLKLENNFSDKIFIQTKAYDVYPKCFIGGLKPFLYTDGFIYQCSATALYNRAFGKEWRICHMNEIKDIWPHNYKFPDNSMCEKGKCFYCEHNKLLDEIQQEVVHNDFI